MTEETPALPDLLLVAGIPATGKSTFGRFLAERHGYAHYDFEHHPQGWAVPELYAMWSASREKFVEMLRARHARTVIDWGFPLEYIIVIRELQSLGARLIWFDGDVNAARVAFFFWGGLDLRPFERQVESIAACRHEIDGLAPLVVQGLAPDGHHRGSDEILAELRPRFDGRHGPSAVG